MKIKTFVLSVSLIIILLWFTAQTPASEQTSTNLQVSKETQKCLQCHTYMQHNLVISWQQSKHAQSAVGCYECHKANANDKDAFNHNGFVISLLVTPKDCSRCHAKEFASFEKSAHAHAGKLLQTQDNFWGEIAEGHAAALNGCQACHGSKIVIDDNTQKPDSSCYPNSGIGRINPDGSSGNCNACHKRHSFKLSEARSAQTCGRCHFGPDHPELETWKSSKHGVTFAHNNRNVDFGKEHLILGKDNMLSPNCATCHLGATASGLKATHNPATRLSWNNMRDISVKRENWHKKRNKMKLICKNCHTSTLINNYYTQYDKGINLYNQKFIKPAKQIMQTLYDNNLLDKNPANDAIERDYWHLWHFEGSCARKGLSMQGPDFVQWKGFYKMSLNFYFKFLKEAEKLKPGILNKILNKPEHKWLLNKFENEKDFKENFKYSIDFWKQE